MKELNSQVRHLVAVGMVISVACLVSGNGVQAQDRAPREGVDPVHREIRELEITARRLAANGQEENAREHIAQARRLRAEAEERQFDAERMGREQGIGNERPEVLEQVERMMSLRRELRELRQSGRHEEAEEVERRITEWREEQRARQVGAREGRPGARNPEGEEMERRMHHLRVAAENLHAIDMHDIAERLQQEAEELERRLHQGSVPPMVAELRQAIERMQGEIRELHEAVGSLNQRMERMVGAHQLERSGSERRERAVSSPTH